MATGGGSCEAEFALHGNPFVAIVLDPLRSTHLGTPQLKAFRAYPPEYQSSIGNECPDGSIETSEQARLERWGSCWNRYYELGVEYYMSSTSRKILGDLTQNYLWMTSFKRKDETQQGKALQEVAEGAIKAAQEIGSGGMATSGTGGAGLNPLSFGSLPQSAAGLGAKPMSSSKNFESSIGKLQSVATQELAQSTLRQVQKSVFKVPASDVSLG
ncbi:MAG: hypothetical protein SGARI_001435 [Bacillariaceae sp.]